jgi:hypothetical protein
VVYRRRSGASRRRAGAANVQLGVAVLLASLVGSGEQPKRRTEAAADGNGRRRRRKGRARREAAEAAMAHRSSGTRLNRGADPKVSQARTPRRPAAARRPDHGRLGQMGLGGPGGWAGADAGRSGSGMRARPKRIGWVLFFSEFILMRKQFQKNLEIV